MLQAALLFDIHCVNTRLSGHVCVTSMNWHTHNLINMHKLKLLASALPLGVVQVSKLDSPPALTSKQPLSACSSQPSPCEA